MYVALIFFYISVLSKNKLVFDTLHDDSNAYINFFLFSLICVKRLRRDIS
jgi:hypothetical protein